MRSVERRLQCHSRYSLRQVAVEWRIIGDKFDLIAEMGARDGSYATGGI